MTIPESYDLVLLDPHTLHFREEAHRLQLRRAGEDDWCEVAVLRLFPLSEPDQWISVRNEKGEEFGILETLHGLDAASLAAVHRNLRRRYLVPLITHIHACTTRFDLYEWDVDTNRGRLTFLMRNPQDSIKQLLPGMYALTDLEGNRYDVRDIAALDEESRGVLEAKL